METNHSHTLLTRCKFHLLSIFLAILVRLILWVSSVKCTFNKIQMVRDLVV